jgi:hypothetical protein
MTIENRTGKNWTVEELEAVSAEYIAHVPVAEIAKHHGRSYMAIVTRLQRLGLMKDGKRIVEQPAEVSQ